jgi:hypothetical protein
MVEDGAAAHAIVLEARYGARKSDSDVIDPQDLCHDQLVCATSIMARFSWRWTCMADQEYDYDMALSFAGEDRSYVDEVSGILHALGVRVFYDKYETTDLWGKDLYVHLDDVYRKKSKYCVIFISASYGAKLWTSHERQSAQARAFESNGEYVLPVRFDDTEIPGIRPTTGYLDLRKMRPDELAHAILRKVGLQTELDEMIQFLREYLVDYTIEEDGTDICFKCEKENNYVGYFPTRLLLEMYRIDQLEHMGFSSRILCRSDEQELARTA